ncbi:TauD/TfdA family dioxygenase [Bacillus siamensis]|uniref:TauD/TfdA family dioxygenase n=1 Tax=Bacillus siamensis TaxID=659243 RepID=UPI0002F77AB4|nr:TauD/TfdA family dioxygenase [Bacillus siamensis]
MSTLLTEGKSSSLGMSEGVVLEISQAEKELIENLIKDINFNPNAINNSDLNRLQFVSHNLPDRVKSALINFKRNSNREGTILFKNLPTDDILPQTPDDGNPSLDKITFVSELCLVLFMLYMGEPIGYADEKNGQLIHDICPIKGKESGLENSGSKVFFTYHTEDAIHPYRPDHLALYCLRSDHKNEAQTETASIVNALELLPSSVVLTLREPLYKLSPPASFNSDDLSKIIPVLSGSIQAPEMVIHCSLMEGITEEAKWALELLKEALSKVSIKVPLCPGDLIIIDNRLAAHARSSFTPQYDGNDRWLQRMFTVNDLGRSSFSRSPGSHVCIPLKYELKLK